MIEPRFHIVGLDLSLSATGVSRIRPHDPVPVTVSLVTSGAVPNAKYHHTLARLRGIARRIVESALRGSEEGDIIVFVMEAPIYPSTKMLGMYHTRAGLWWLVYHLVEKLGLVVHIEPTKLKSYVTGNGRASKDEVKAKIILNHPGVVIIDDNEADAVGLADMAARELGFPQEPSVQRCNPGALGGVDWPEYITQRRLTNG